MINARHEKLVVVLRRIVENVETRINIANAA